MSSARASSALAEIWYYTNYSDPKAPTIRLGMIAEAATKKSRVLVMLARERLTDRELEHVSGFNRQQLENVWATLSDIMQEAWSKRPDREEAPKAGAMLKFLAEKYAMSLHIQPPDKLVLPPAVVAKAVREPKSLGHAVLDILEKRLRSPAPSKGKKLPKKSTARAKAPRATVRRIPLFRESTVTDAVAML